MTDEPKYELEAMEDESPIVQPSLADEADSSTVEDLQLAPVAQTDVREESSGDLSGVAPLPSSGQTNPVLREYEKDVHDTIVELRRIESDIRTIMQDRDPVRKRKFTGTAKWHELEDDLIKWRFSGRFEEETLRRVQEMIGRRHYLFRHLKYLSSTRPVWNS